MLILNPPTSASDFCIGLIGSACVRLLHEVGWDVVGVDNDMRRQFFGEQGTALPVVEQLCATLSRSGISSWIYATTRASVSF
jgi:nucleoside-diphosphate-sugar epimerase